MEKEYGGGRGIGDRGWGEVEHTCYAHMLYFRILGSHQGSMMVATIEEGDGAS